MCPLCPLPPQNSVRARFCENRKKNLTKESLVSRPSNDKMVFYEFHAIGAPSRCADNAHPHP